MTILTVGIDLAKNVFAVHGVNEAGKADLVRLAVPRDQLKAAVTAFPPCVIGMEACSGAHWPKAGKRPLDGIRRAFPSPMTVSRYQD